MSVGIFDKPCRCNTLLITHDKNHSNLVAVTLSYLVAVISQHTLAAIVTSLIYIGNDCLFIWGCLLRLYLKCVMPQQAMPSRFLTVSKHFTIWEFWVKQPVHCLWHCFMCCLHRLLFTITIQVAVSTFGEFESVLNRKKINKYSPSLSHHRHCASTQGSH